MVNGGPRTLALIFVLTSRTSDAFSVANHEAITRAAVDQFERCVASGVPAAHGLAPLGENVSLLVRCNAAQDQLTKKILVWHFYSPTRKLDGDARLVSFVGTLLFGRDAFDTTFHQWFGRLTSELQLATNRTDAYPTLGALAHFLQDVAVPAHVVPVFHPDPFYNVDNFDYYDLVPVPPRMDAASCERLLSSPENSFDGILDATAAYTLAAVRRDIPGLEPTSVTSSEMPRTWRLFWEPPLPDSDGFGRYGCVGDHFGDHRLTCNDEALVVPDETYRTFAADLQQHAIDATVRAIVVMQRNITREGPSTMHDCPVPKAASDSHGRHVVVVARENAIQ